MHNKCSSYGANAILQTQAFFQTTTSSSGIQNRETEYIIYDANGKKSYDTVYGSNTVIGHYSNGVLSEVDTYEGPGAAPYNLLSSSFFDSLGQYAEDYYDSQSGIYRVTNRQAEGWVLDTYLSDQGVIYKQVARSSSGGLLYNLQSDAVIVDNTNRSATVTSGGSHWTSTPEAVGVTLPEGLNGSTTFDFTPRSVPIGNQYDTIANFRSGVDKIDLSQLAFSDVVIDNYNNGWTSVFFATNGLGNIAVHGTVAAGNLFVGLGANVSFIKDH